MKKIGSYTFNHSILDKEHALLFLQTQHLSSLINHRTEDETLIKLLDNLIEASVAHNFTEESLMYTLNTYNGEGHILEHRLLVHEMVQIRNTLQTNLFQQQTDFKRLIKKWQEHLFKFDKDMIEKLNE